MTEESIVITSKLLVNKSKTSRGQAPVLINTSKLFKKNRKNHYICINDNV